MCLSIILSDYTKFYNFIKALYVYNLIYLTINVTDHVKIQVVTKVFFPFVTFYLRCLHSYPFTQTQIIILYHIIENMSFPFRNKARFLHDATSFCTYKIIQPSGFYILYTLYTVYIKIVYLESRVPNEKRFHLSVG